MPLEGRWTVFVCTGCGGVTGRHKACEAGLVRTPVVPVDERSVAKAAESITGLLDGRDDARYVVALVVEALRAAGEQPTPDPDAQRASEATCTSPSPDS